MTYKEAGYADDNNVYRADLDRLSSAVRRFVASGKPGLAALFVYAVRPDGRPLFRAFANTLALQTEVPVAFYSHTHQGGNRNLAALFYVGFQLPNSLPPPGVRLGLE